MPVDIFNKFAKDYFGLEIIIFTLSFVFCLLPKAIKKVDKLSKIFPILTLASAGFLLAVLLLDFIPHMFPHEHVVLNNTPSKHTHNASQNCCNHTHAHDDHDQAHYNTIVGMVCAGLSLLGLIGIDQCIIKHDHCEESHDEHLHDTHHEHVHHFHSENIQQSNICNELESEDFINQDIGCCNTKMLKNTESKTKALIYIFSISIHSFFEGLAMKKSTFTSYEFGIILHKILESFAIGMTLFNSAFSFLVCLLMNAFYSFLTPLGMFISRYFGSNLFQIGKVPISVIFNGLALGSLMFIVFLEMIPGAFHKKGNKSLKMLGLVLGFVLSASLIVLTGHSH